MTVEELDEKIAEIFNDLIYELKKCGDRIEVAAKAAKQGGLEEEWIGVVVAKRQKEYEKACAEL